MYYRNIKSFEFQDIDGISKDMMKYIFYYYNLI